MCVAVEPGVPGVVLLVGVRFVRVPRASVVPKVVVAEEARLVREPFWHADEDLEDVSFSRGREDIPDCVLNEC